MKNDSLPIVRAPKCNPNTTLLSSSPICLSSVRIPSFYSNEKAEYSPQSIGWYAQNSETFVRCLLPSELSSKQKAIKKGLKLEDGGDTNEEGDELPKMAKHAWKRRRKERDKDGVNQGSSGFRFRWWYPVPICLSEDVSPNLIIRFESLASAYLFTNPRNRFEPTVSDLPCLSDDELSWATDSLETTLNWRGKAMSWAMASLGVTLNWIRSEDAQSCYFLHSGESRNGKKWETGIKKKGKEDEKDADWTQVMNHKKKKRTPVVVSGVKPYLSGSTGITVAFNDLSSQSSKSSSLGPCESKEPMTNVNPNEEITEGQPPKDDNIEIFGSDLVQPTFLKQEIDIPRPEDELFASNMINDQGAGMTLSPSENGLILANLLHRVPAPIDDDIMISDGFFHSFHTNNTMHRQLEELEVKTEGSKSTSSKRKVKGGTSDTATSTLKGAKKPRI